MCWATPLHHKCSLQTCEAPKATFKQTTALSPCQWRKHLGKSVHWPKGCSTCMPIKREHPTAQIGPHVAPHEHATFEEHALVVRRSICPGCQKAEGITEPQIGKQQIEDEAKEIQPKQLAEIFCGILKIATPRTSDLACAIADALEPVRLKHGLAPHAFTTACVYAASHIAPCPNPFTIDHLITVFNMRTRTWFLHAYESLFAARHRIVEEGIVNHSTVLFCLPKPCCQRPQNRLCPRQRSEWGYEIDKCTGKQVDGLGVKGGYVGFRNFLHDGGVPVNNPDANYYRETDLELLRQDRLPDETPGKSRPFRTV